MVAALSGRPPKRQPAHRFAAAGVLVLAAGIVLLAFTDKNRAGFIISGTIASVIGLLLLAPLAIQGVALLAGRAPISLRLALRDLARYQARSGAALGAATLAIAIAATIAISAAAAQTTSPKGNLPANELVLYIGQKSLGPGSAVPVIERGPDGRGRQRRQSARRVAAREERRARGALQPERAGTSTGAGTGR